MKLLHAAYVFVELEGKEELITALTTLLKKGMVVYTNSPKVRLDRRTVQDDFVST